MMLAEGEHMHRAVAFDSAARVLFGGMSAAMINDKLKANSETASSIVSSLIGTKLIITTPTTPRDWASLVQ